MSLDYFWEDESFEGGSFVFRDGYGAIIDGLASTLDIRLNTIVTKVSYGYDGVSVKTKNGEEIRAKKALVTVPLGVLKANDIQFAPALPAKVTRAISRIGFGAHEKVILAYEEKFWPGLGMIFVADAAVGSYFTFYDFTFVYGVPTLVAFNGGETSASTLSSMSDEEIVEACAREISAMLGISAPAPVDSIVTRWKEDPFTKGSYTYVAVGSSPDDMDVLAETIGNSLYFAGEGTTSSYYGQTHGALISGVRAARQMNYLASLGNL